MLAACASPLEEPISNSEGCRAVFLALEDRCQGADAIRYLNCDLVPGCPGGKVERKDVTACIQRIQAASSCEDAKAQDCAFDKLDCGDAAPFYLAERGVADACADLATALTTAGAGCAVDPCPLAACAHGVADKDQVDACAARIAGKASCAEATTEYTACVATVRVKYCL